MASRRMKRVPDRKYERIKLFEGEVSQENEDKQGRNLE
jgi:hypothetical protein